MSYFLIIHGLGGSTGGHWQEWLAAQLQKRGETCLFPQFPQWDRPNKAQWLNQLRCTIDCIPERAPLTVVTHSLGCALWLHYAASSDRRRADRLVLVSPPAPDIPIEATQDFFPLPDQSTDGATGANQTIIISSTNDPYLPQEKWPSYINYGVPFLVLPATGHINVKSGFGAWPWLLDYCLNDRTASPLEHHPITAEPAQ
ncbi:MAG: alpha/beta fold hydrolase [Sporolactobacillus sp.]